MTATLEFITVPALTRISLTGDVRAAVEETVRPMVRAVPLTQQPVVRRMVEESIVPAMEELAAGGAACALAAINPFDPSPIRPVIAFVPIDLSAFGEGADGAPTLEILSQLAAQDPEADLVDLGDLVAVRSSSTADVTAALLEAIAAVEPSLNAAMASPPAQPDVPAALPAAPPPVAGRDAAEPEFARLRVQYVAAERTEGPRWLSAQLTLDYPDTAEGRELCASWSALFDALMTTVRWTR